MPTMVQFVSMIMVQFVIETVPTSLQFVNETLCSTTLLQFVLETIHTLVQFVIEPDST